MYISCSGEPGNEASSQVEFNTEDRASSPFPTVLSGQKGKEALFVQSLCCLNSLVPRPSIPTFWNVNIAHVKLGNPSLVPRPSITANVVVGLVNLLRRMTSGGHMVDVGCLEAWYINRSHRN